MAQIISQTCCICVWIYVFACICVKLTSILMLTTIASCVKSTKRYFAMCHSKSEDWVYDDTTIIMYPGQLTPLDNFESVMSDWKQHQSDHVAQLYI